MRTGAVDGLTEGDADLEQIADFEDFANFDHEIEDN